MEVLKHDKIQGCLINQTFFDLSYNNEKLNVIAQLDENPIKKLEDIFNSFITLDNSDTGYYQLRNLFMLAKLHDENAIINLILNAINKKISIINDSIVDENNQTIQVSLGMYIQIWKSYKNFCNNIYVLIRNYQQHLVDRKVVIDKMKFDILSVMQMCMFYISVIDNPKNNILNNMDQDLSDIDKRNIDQLIEYVDSIRVFMLMRDFAEIETSKLSDIIKLIINKTMVVNTMCNYMHQLLKNLSNKSLVDDDDYETVMADNSEKKTMKQIYKIATILSTYADKKMIIVCYTKFMQSRILDLKYDNLELEIELIRRMSRTLGKDDSQRLINAITDMMNNKNTNSVIQSANIAVKQEKYMSIPNISTQKISPIILTKNNWKIYNMSELEPIYPLEIECYLEIISKCYANIYDNAYAINWQPTLGSARFTANLGGYPIEITCNMLQAILLCYFNSNTDTDVTIERFSKDVLISMDLATKIFESLLDANLLICYNTNENDEQIYIVNKRNYTGDLHIDTRKNFVEAFEETDPEDKSLSNNCVMKASAFKKNSSDIDSDDSDSVDSTDYVKKAMPKKASNPKTNQNKLPVKSTVKSIMGGKGQALIQKATPVKKVVPIKKAIVQPVPKKVAVQAKPAILSESSDSEDSDDSESEEHKPTKKVVQPKRLDQSGESDQSSDSEVETPKQLFKQLVKLIDSSDSEVETPKQSAKQPVKQPVKPEYDSEYTDDSDDY